MKKLELQPIRNLKNIFAASGLVKIDNTFYVIADDDFSIALIEEKREVALFPLIQGVLPKDHHERKKMKPDWEALTLVRENGLPTGLLAVPSGSKPNRQTGSFMSLDVSRVAVAVDFSQVYSSLQTAFPHLNIEGACFTQKYFQLFQRGNGPDAKNAVINLDLEGVLEDIRSTQVVAAHRVLGFKEYSLGEIAGIPLSFTDACFVNGNETWFLAVAEAGASTYDDGHFAGALLGVIDGSGSVKETFELNTENKPEGLDVEIGDQNERIIHIVTDADSSEIPAVLYRGVLP